MLDKLPNDLQPQAKQCLQAICMAPARRRTELAFDLFIATYEGKYPKAVDCLAQDREVLLTFYDFPAEHTCRALPDRGHERHELQRWHAGRTGRLVRPAYTTLDNNSVMTLVLLVYSVTLHRLQK